MIPKIRGLGMNQYEICILIAGELRWFGVIANSKAEAKDFLLANEPFSEYSAEEVAQLEYIEVVVE